jgi:2,3-diketo-5-methylthio-1-phosphopentane phosphatase
LSVRLRYTPRHKFLDDKGDPAIAPIVFVDFDGTAAAEIASNRLLDRFAVADWRELDRRFDQGVITFRERVVKGFSLLSGSRADFEGFSRSLELRPGFGEFVRFCRERGWDLVIVSEALDVMVEAMLERAGLLDLEVYCNRALFHEDGRFCGIELPHVREDCVCEVGLCKRAVLRRRAQGDKFIVYIGDGSNDLCPAREADLVFARRRLAEGCEREGIPFVPFEDFYEIREKLQSSDCPPIPS